MFAEMFPGFAAMIAYVMKEWTLYDWILHGLAGIGALVVLLVLMALVDALMIWMEAGCPLAPPPYQTTFHKTPSTQQIRQDQTDWEK